MFGHHMICANLTIIQQVHAWLYVCLYDILLLGALHLGCQTFTRPSTMTHSDCQSFLFKIHPTITFPVNNIITRCSYYVHLSAILCELLCAIVDNVTSIFYSIQEAFKILTGSIKSRNMSVIMLCILTFLCSYYDSHELTQSGGWTFF